MTILGAEAGLVVLVRRDDRPSEENAEYLDIVGARGYAGTVIDTWRRFPISAPLPLSDAVRNQTPLFFPRRADMETRYPEMFVAKPIHLGKASASLPLVARGRAFGGLHFSFPEEHDAFTEADQALLTELAHQGALALDRALSQERAEASEQRLAFLAQASNVLSASLDYPTTLERLVWLCIPELADWAAVDIRAPDGTLQRLAIAHYRPDGEKAMWELNRRYPPEPQRHPALTALATGETQQLADITDAMLQHGAADAEHLRLLRQVGVCAFITVLLATRGTALGTITFGMSPSPEGSGRAFGPEATALAEELAHRAAVAVDNARIVAQMAALHTRQHDYLQQSEERFRLLVESVRDYAIFMLDPQGNISTWNAGAERFKGYKAEEIVGQHFSRFYTAEDIARRHPWNELEIAAREGRYEEEGWRVRKDGSHFWASVVITALRDEKGRLCGFGKVTRDVTERRLREQERVTTQAMEQQRRFLKDVLASVTQGKLVLCDSRAELPTPLAPVALGAPISLSRQALKAVRSRVTEAAIRCGLPQDRLQDLITAASESAMNALQHAGGGRAQVYEGDDSHRVQVWIEDEGKGIDLDRLPRATLETGFTTGGGGIGHGFFLMLSLADRVYLLTGPEGTTVVLEKARASQEPAWLQVNEFRAT